MGTDPRPATQHASARCDRSARPTGVIIDSQSARTTECGDFHCYDASKRINGHKRHLLVDMSDARGSPRNRLEFCCGKFRYSIGRKVPVNNALSRVDRPPGVPLCRASSRKRVGRSKIMPSIQTTKTIAPLGSRPLTLAALLRAGVAALYAARGMPWVNVDDLAFAGAGMDLAATGRLTNHLMRPWLAAFGTDQFFIQLPGAPYALAAWIKVAGVGTASFLVFQWLWYVLGVGALLRVTRFGFGLTASRSGRRCCGGRPYAEAGASGMRRLRPGRKPPFF